MLRSSTPATAEHRSPRGRGGLAVLAAGVLVAAYAIWTWVVRGVVIQPDFDSYTHGGLGLYPSPIGRALGALGPNALASVSIAASAVCVYAVAQRSERPSLAAWAFALSPATLQLGYAGIDPIGLALLLVAFAGVRPASMLVLSVLTHLSLLPFALLQFARSHGLVRKIGLGFAISVAVSGTLFTQYRGVLHGSVGPTMVAAFLVGLAAGILLSLPALLVFRPSRLWTVALVIGALECALVVSVQPRYFLPAAAIAVFGPVRPFVTLVADRVGRRWSAAPRPLVPSRPEAGSPIAPRSCPSSQNSRQTWIRTRSGHRDARYPTVTSASDVQDPLSLR